jgi:hypothetical protein
LEVVKRPHRKFSRFCHFTMEEDSLNLGASMTD